MSVYGAFDSAVDAFTGSIEFRWEQPNDPVIVAAKIRALSRSLEDLTPVLEGAREIVVGDVEEHFAEERGPTGEEWAEWSPSYAPVAERENKSKLRKSDDLYEAATDRSAYVVAGNDMFLDTTGFPVYWAIQQYGGLIMSGQTLIRRYGKRRRGEEGASEHGRIPARPYLGMSTEAEASVAALFDQFITGEIIGFMETPLAGPGARVARLRSGRFARIGR